MSEVLCRVAEIPDGGVRCFTLARDGEPLEIFVHRRGGAVVAYVNRCPHQGTPLDIIPGRVLTRDRRHFLCATHGAQFRLDDGLCVRGPCRGAALAPAPVRVRDGCLVADR